MLVLVVVAHAVASAYGKAPNPWGALQSPTTNARSLAATLYSAFAGASAAAAGFAGVVIIFGMDTRSEKFFRFRTAAAGRLRANWLSVIGSSFGAAATAFAAAIMVPLASPWLAAWFFELALLLIVHAALRMLWLLAVLMDVVATDDATKIRAANVAPLPSVRHRA